MSEPRPPRDSLSDILTLDGIGPDHFRATLEGFWGDATHGDLAARAALAAAAGGEPVRSVHAQFAREHRCDQPLELVVDRPTDGLGQVRATVDGAWLGAFDVRTGAAPAHGMEYQTIEPALELPAPEDLPTERESAALEGWLDFAVGPIETRRVGEMAPAKQNDSATWRGWLAPREALAPDPQLHAAALVFLAGYRSHWSIERRMGSEFRSSAIYVTDFACWLHRAHRWDDFLLVQTDSDIGVSGRCHCRRSISTRGGVPIATAAWEATVSPHA